MRSFLNLENLESREVPANVFWTSTGWSGGQAFQSGDNLTINSNAGDLDLSGVGASIAIGDLDIGSSTTGWADKILTLPNSCSVTGTATIYGGTGTSINYNYINFAHSGYFKNVAFDQTNPNGTGCNVTFSGGTNDWTYELDGTVLFNDPKINVTSNGTLRVDAGSIIVDASANKNSVLTISSSCELNISGTTEFDLNMVNNGNIDLGKYSDGTETIKGYLDSRGNVLVESGNTVNFNADTTISVSNGYWNTATNDVIAESGGNLLVSTGATASFEHGLYSFATGYIGMIYDGSNTSADITGTVRVDGSSINLNWNSNNGVGIYTGTGTANSNLNITGDVKFRDSVIRSNLDWELNGGNGGMNTIHDTGNWHMYHSSGISKILVPNTLHGPKEIVTRLDQPVVYASSSTVDSGAWFASSAIPTPFTGYYLTANQNNSGWDVLGVYAEPQNNGG